MSLSLNYAAGVDCTWHGPLRYAIDVTTTADTEGQFRCPGCGAPVKAMNSDTFWAAAREQERKSPDSLLMLTWSQVKCFPDAETAVNAFRQAMEGEQ